MIGAMPPSLYVGPVCSTWSDTELATKFKDHRGRKVCGARRTANGADRTRSAPPTDDEALGGSFARRIAARSDGALHRGGQSRDHRATFLLEPRSSCEDDRFYLS